MNNELETGKCIPSCIELQKSEMIKKKKQNITKQINAENHLSSKTYINT